MLSLRVSGSFTQINTLIINIFRRPVTSQTESFFFCSWFFPTFTEFAVKSLCEPFHFYLTSDLRGRHKSKRSGLFMVYVTAVMVNHLTSKDIGWLRLLKCEDLLFLHSLENWTSLCFGLQYEWKKNFWRCYNGLLSFLSTISWLFILQMSYQ